MIEKFVNYFFDTRAGLLLEDGDRSGDRHCLGVDQIAGGAARHIVDETCGRIDIHGGAYDDEIVCLFAQFSGGFDIGHSLAKPYDVGTQLGSVGGFVADVDVTVADVDNQVVIAIAARLCQ